MIVSGTLAHRTEGTINIIMAHAMIIRNVGAAIATAAELMARMESYSGMLVLC